jgi:hypothetical protein
VAGHLQCLELDMPWENMPLLEIILLQQLIATTIIVVNNNWVHSFKQTINFKGIIYQHNQSSIINTMGCSCSVTQTVCMLMFTNTCPFVSTMCVDTLVCMLFVNILIDVNRNKDNSNCSTCS